MEKAGLETKKASSGSVEQSVAVVGELDFDRTSYAVLAPRATVLFGTSTPIRVSVAEREQPVALIEAADVGRAKSEFLNSLLQVERRAGIVRDMEGVGNLIPDPQFREMKANLGSASSCSTIIRRSSI